MISRSNLETLAFWCAFGSALSTMFSISISQSLLAAGLVLLLISGFMRHWMTFSGLEMVALLLTVALLLVGNSRPKVRVALGGACAVIIASIVLSLTRGMWVATAVAACYLLWNYNRWLVAALPFLGLLLFYAGP